MSYVFKPAKFVRVRAASRLEKIQQERADIREKAIKRLTDRRWFRYSRAGAEAVVDEAGTYTWHKWQEESVLVPLLKAANQLCPDETVQLSIDDYVELIS